MKTYIYKAKAGPDKEVEGEVFAESEAAAAASVDAMGYVPVWVREKPTESSRSFKGLLVGRVSFREVTVFTRQLASLTKSGVPILKALSTISEQTENPRLVKIVQEIEVVVRDGSMLSAALKKYPSLFPDLYISMVRAGETGGVLDNVLFRLAEARERDDELRRKVQSAVAYPLLITAVGIMTIVFLLTFLLPRVVVLFKNYSDLPLPTRIIMGLSAFFSKYWLWLVVLIGLCVLLAGRLAAMEKGKFYMDRMKLKMPLIGKFVLRSNIARFTRTLALLLDSGIPIDRALILSSETLANSVLKEEIDELGLKTVNEGATVSSGLKRAEYFPPLVANMTAVGEEAGRMDESLLEVAEYYEREIDQLSKMATSLIEPVLILTVGLMVGFIVAAMLLPIFQLGTSL